MKRRLLRQMTTEWRSNIWLILELVIVGSCLFYVTFSLYNFVRVYMQTEGYNGAGTVIIHSQYRTEADEGFVPYDSLPDDENYQMAGKLKEKAELIRRLRENPLVAEVGYGMNAMPYNLNFYGTGISHIDGEDTVSIPVNKRTMSPEFVDVINLEGYGDFDSAQLREALERGECILTANSFDIYNQNAEERSARKLSNPSDLIGMTFSNIYADEPPFKIGALMQNMKRNQYEEANNATIIVPVSMPVTYLGLYNNVVVSLKPGVSQNQFIEDVVAKLNSLYTVGNLSISRLVPTDSVMAVQGRSQRQSALYSLGCISFLCLSIFLGLLGTFWVRTRQRIKEIAIRMVNGASVRSVMCRMISEGFILLLCSAPLIFLVEYLIYSKDLMPQDYGEGAPGRYLAVTNCLTFAALAIMILAGILIPASKAVKISPAEALQED